MSKSKKDKKELVSKVIAGNDVKAAIKKAVSLMGGFGKAVKQGDEIVVKPNFNTNDTFPGSSDPQFVKAVIELLYEHGAKKVVLAESSCFHTNSRKQMSLMIPVAEKAGAEVIILDEKNDWKNVQVDGRYMKSFNVSETFLNAKKTVWLPCMKTHKQARFTLSLKLPMGMIKGSDRMKMHLINLEKKLADLNLAVPAPDLIIMDARKCFITGGPSKGKVRGPGLIIAGKDRIAVDVEAIKVIQEFQGNKLGKKSPWEFSQIKCAVENRIGSVKSPKDYKVIFADTIAKKKAFL